MSFGTPVAMALGLSLALTIWSGRPYPDDPPPAHTGGFGEPTCHSCHFGAPLNAPGGSLTVQGLPETYRPGGSYRLTVAVSRPGLGRAGFQAAARYAGEPHTGRQAGELATFGPGARIVVSGEPPVQYAQHQEAGTGAAFSDTARWSIEWTAPETARGPVAFHVAANASNDDASEFGDLIYTLERTISAAETR